MSKVSIKRAAQKAVTADRRARQVAGEIKTRDSFQNFALGLGIGTNNTSSGNTYGFNPITRVRTELEWMYRGTWLAGSAVDVIANDMTREGVEITGQLEPDEIEEIEEEAVTLRIWERLNQAIKWSRLYGGSICVLLIDGQDYSKPFRIETVGPNQFRGLLVLDRWMAMPSLEDLVTEIGPDLGLPKYYTVDVSAPALRGKRVHYSRCIRLIGDELPYWQSIAENMWGMSVLERPFPIISQFDAATAGASQLVSKAYLRYFKIKKYREILATGGLAKKGLQEQVASMRLFASNEGISLIDSEDDMVTSQASVFNGISEVIVHLGEQVAGSLGTPLVRLLGQTPGGLNTDGDSQMKTYADGIRQKQQREKVGITKIYRCIAQSRRIDVSSGFGIKFKSLFQMDEKEKSEIAERDTRSACAVYETGKISDRTFLEELAHGSATTNRWQSITNEVIEAASDEVAPDPGELDMPPVPGIQKPGETPAAEPAKVGAGETGETPAKEPAKVADSARCASCESGDCVKHTRATVDGMPSRNSKGTLEEADKLMEYRSFGRFEESNTTIVYYRGDVKRPDTLVRVHFEGDKVATVEIWADGKRRTESGFEALYGAAQAYGD